MHTLEYLTCNTAEEKRTQAQMFRVKNQIKCLYRKKQLSIDVCHEHINPKQNAQQIRTQSAPE